MLTIRIIAVGTLKEDFFRAAVAEYAKRLTKYCKLEIIEVKEHPEKGTSAPRDEAAEIIPKLRGHTILCDLTGEELTSEALAAKIAKLTDSTSQLTFVIGGSNGVGSHLDGKVHEKLSFAKITLPHQLFRVVLVEQIYRAMTIIAGESYHK